MKSTTKLVRATGKEKSQRKIHPKSPHRTRAYNAQSPFLRLERTIGNRAMGQMIQAKLKIGIPNDKYEQEADRVADMVMRMPEPVDEQRQPYALLNQQPSIQRFCPECEEEEEATSQRQPLEENEALRTKKDSAIGSTIPAKAAINKLYGGGAPLHSQIRDYFEPRFGRNFGDVRIHTGSDAEQATRSVRAKAFTFGRNIVFGRGRYAPETENGKHLLAHELTHVVQQSSGVGISLNKTLNIQRHVQVSRCWSQNIIQCAQLGRPSSSRPYFTYILDQKRNLYSQLASYYGLENWRDIQRFNISAAFPRGRPQGKLFRGLFIHIPARFYSLLVQDGTGQRIGLQQGLVTSTRTRLIPFRWWNRNNANLIGRVPRGTRIQIGLRRGGYNRVWIPTINLRNAARGIIWELFLLRRTAGYAADIYGYLPVANTRRAARRVAAGEINLLARMIWGEQRDQGRAAMVAAAWTVKNRYNAGWGMTYNDILTDREYRALGPPINARHRNMNRLTGTNLSAWTMAENDVARGVINGTIPDTTRGRGFYFCNQTRTYNCSWRMRNCRRRLGRRFYYRQIRRTNMYWSNGDHSGYRPRCTIAR